MKILKSRRDKIGPEPERPRSGFLDWNYEAELFAFGPRLNEKFDKELLLKALTHKSYFNTGKPPHELLSSEDNTSLVKEGEALIKMYVMVFFEKSLPRFPIEGRRAVCDYLMTDKMLSHVAKHIGLKDIVLCAVSYFFKVCHFFLLPITIFVRIFRFWIRR